MSNQETPRRGRPWLRLAALAALVIGGLVALRASGLSGHLTLDNLQGLSQTVRNLGWVAPLVYVLLWLAACLFFLPGLPLTLLGAVVFGVWWGILWVTIGANLGAALAFLAARYAVRPLVESWVAQSGQFQKIDQGLARHGWRMIMITRLVPLFPFNLQNYAYGLTKISFATYALVSLLSMLPATVAYCLAGGALVSGKGDLKRTLLYFAAAAVFFVFVSLLPGWIKKRYADIGIVSKRTISSNRGPKPPTRVLFVCLHNSARSVMAEHFLRKYDGTSFLPESAGFEPTDVLPLAVEVMDEIGIDISGHRSQSVQELHQAGRSYDYIITLCSDFGGHRIPDFPGATLLHWSFEEPSTFNGSQQEKLFRTRKVRGQIQVATTNWVKELTTTY